MKEGRIGTDEQIAKDVEWALYWDSRVNEKNVKTEVTNRDVILEGTVSTHRARKAAEEGASNTPGVRSVKNNLMVRVVDVDLPEDSVIKSRIEQMLSWHQEIDEKKIEISVRGGLVTLSGSVDALWKRMYVQELASNVTGIFEIKNELSVVPTSAFRDEAIAREIMGAIEKDTSVEIGSINVEVKEGIVRLSGTVKNRCESRDVYSIAMHIAGVKDIENRLKVRS
jgi:osmotically-inducible protein OsmY